MLESSKRGCSVADLVAETEVSDKTVRRDLKVLEAVFDISTSTNTDRIKRWQMKSFSEQAGFCLTDLLSIHMGRQFLEPLAGTPFWEGYRKVLRKVKAAVGEHALRYIEKLADTVTATSVGISDYSDRGAMIDQLMVAIEDRKVTLIVYQSDQATEPVEQEVYPQGFVFHRGSLYLIAWSSRRAEIRTFKMDRIEDVHPSNLQATIPREFHLADWLEHSFGVFQSGSGQLQTIRIRFTRDVARYVKESRWHSSQKLTPQKDGSLMAEFRLSDTQEIKRWIMSFGPNATVLNPQELVEEIAADLTQMQQAYSQQSFK